MRDIVCHAFREQFVTYAWQTARDGANYASPCRLDFVPLKCHDLVRHITRHCGNTIRAGVRLAYDVCRCLSLCRGHVPLQRFTLICQYAYFCLLTECVCLADVTRSTFWPIKMVMWQVLTVPTHAWMARLSRPVRLLI